jgi:hypothetical protein
MMFSSLYRKQANSLILYKSDETEAEGKRRLDEENHPHHF